MASTTTSDLSQHLDADVAIIGGGIAGLYTAWRLATTTNYKIVVAEYTHRFGGRYLTCTMPGGFPADLGAMRYIPSMHPITDKLISDLQLVTEPFFSDITHEGSTIKKFPNHADAKDLATFEKAHKTISAATCKNWYATKVPGTSIMAKDMSMGLWFSLNSNRAPVVNLDEFDYPSTITVADNLEFVKVLNGDADGETEPRKKTYHCIKNGMESLIHALVAFLSGYKRVTLLLNSPIIRVEEAKSSFLLKSKTVEIQAERLVLACNSRGIELLTWISPHNRVTSLQRLLNNVVKVQGFKLFLTFRTAWWERFGLLQGSIETFPPYFRAVAFGKRGKSDQFATLLAAFSYVQQDIFEGLNKSEKKFKNVVGSVPEDLTPSQDLVDYVLHKLATRLDVDRMELPDPVCAAAKIWNSDPINAGNFQSKIGVDSNQLQWRVMKPFDDLPVFITGDTFNAVCDKGLYIGWSEGPLLTSERILVNHFGLDPYLPDLHLQPCSANKHMLKSKL